MNYLVDGVEELTLAERLVGVLQKEVIHRVQDGIGREIGREAPSLSLD